MYDPLLLKKRISFHVLQIVFYILVLQIDQAVDQMPPVNRNQTERGWFLYLKSILSNKMFLLILEVSEQILAISIHHVKQYFLIHKSNCDLD